LAVVEVKEAEEAVAVVEEVMVMIIQEDMEPLG
jgi:hypothetical protein